MNGKLNLNMNKVKEARDYAQRIASEVHNFVEEHTTVSIERAICRFFGIDGVDDYGIPIPNVVVDHLKSSNLINDGAAYVIGNAILETGLSPQKIAEEISFGRLDLRSLSYRSQDEVFDRIDRLVNDAVGKVQLNREKRESLIGELGEGKSPTCM